MDIVQLLAKGVEAYPDNTVLIDGDRRLTFKQLHARTNTFANAVMELGLKKGDRVAAISMNCAEVVEVDYGLMKAGVVMVALNLRSTSAELRYMINNAKAKAVILGPEYIDAIQDIREDLKETEHFICLSNTPGDMIDYETLMASSSDREPRVKLDKEDLASFLYTSGTTGKLKAAMLTHKNWVARCMNLLIEIEPIQEHEVNLSVAPMRHTGPILFLPFHLSGASTVIVRRFDMVQVLEAIEKHKVTHTFMVPTMINAMLDHPELDKYDLSNLKCIIYGASPMPVEVLRRGINKLGPVFEQLYGSSEALPIVTFLPKRYHKVEGSPKDIKRLASAGRPGKAVEVMISDEQGNEALTGEAGEIITRGDHVMAGYWGEPELTKEAFKGGWFHTGDMAYKDEDGFYYMVDRKKDLIISGGFNVYPKEVEDVIYKHPSVSEVAVIGVPSGRWGEEVKAIIFLRPGTTATQEEIIALCRQGLADYKRPKSVEFRSEPLPKSSVGKILKREIRETYWKGYDRRIN